MFRPALLALPLLAAACDQMPVPAPAPSPAPVTIPAAAQGSWGLTALDCAGGAAAKGLLTVGPSTLRYYESTGTLASVQSSSATGLTGTFNFTGEGQTWQRVITMEVQDGGSRLVTQSSDSGTLRYTTCA